MIFLKFAIDSIKDCSGKALPVRDARRTKNELTVTEIIATFTVYAKNSVKFLRGPKPDYLPKNQILSDKKFRGMMGKAKKQNVILEAKKYIEYLEQNPRITYSNIATKFHTNKVRVCRIIQIFDNLPLEIINFIAEQNNPDFNWHFSELKLRELTALKTLNEKIDSFQKMLEYFNEENDVSLVFRGVH